MNKQSKTYENIYEISNMYVEHVAKYRLDKCEEDQLMSLILGKTLSTMEENFQMNLDWDGIRYRIARKVEELKKVA